MKEISGGVVKATTTSCRGSIINRAQHDKIKLPKSTALRHLAILPKLVENTR